MSCFSVALPLAMIAPSDINWELTALKFLFISPKLKRPNSSCGQ